jgi:Flp pilus assembly protein TadG
MRPATDQAGLATTRIERRGKIRRRPGASLVEFALTVPILLALMLGVVDAGRMVVAQMTMSNAARECARYAAIHWREAGYWNGAEAASANAAVGLNRPPYDEHVTLETVGGRQYARCRVEYVFQPAAPYFAMMASQVSLTAQSRMLAS